jgi:hypothetical protein
MTTGRKSAPEFELAEHASPPQVRITPVQAQSASGFEAARAPLKPIIRLKAGDGGDDRPSRSHTPIVALPRVHETPTLPPSQPPPQAPEANAARPHAWLASRAGILEAVVAGQGGENTTICGELGAEFAGQMGYLRQVGAVIGLELGFENLREVHIGGKAARYLSLQLADDSCLHVSATNLCNTFELAKAVRDKSP